MSTVTERMEVFKQMMASLDDVYVTELNENFELGYSTCPEIDTMLMLMTLDDDLPGDFRVEQAKEQAKNVLTAPTVFVNSIGMMWISDIWMEEEGLKKVYILGPVFLDDFSVYYLEQALDPLHLSISVRHAFVDFIAKIPKMSQNRLFEYAIMLHSCITNIKVTLSDFIFINTEETRRKQIEEETAHPSYQLEQELMRMVEEGNTSYQPVLNRIVMSGDAGAFGSSRERLRRQKNMVIVFTAITSRAAIRGGLSAETAYTLSDSYMEKIEAASTYSELTILSHSMYQDFILRVHRTRASASAISPQIQKICDYINLNPGRKLTTHELAEKIGYTDYYFTNKFKQEVGVNLSAYITERKIERAKEMLMESNIPVQEIVEHLGFTSHSYFGNVFRKYTGVSPTDYRNGQKERE